MMVELQVVQEPQVVVELVLKEVQLLQALQQLEDLVV